MTVLNSAILDLGTLQEGATPLQPPGVSDVPCHVKEQVRHQLGQPTRATRRSHSVMTQLGRGRCHHDSNLAGTRCVNVVVVDSAHRRCPGPEVEASESRRLRAERSQIAIRIGLRVSRVNRALGATGFGNCGGRAESCRGESCASRIDRVYVFEGIDDSVGDWCESIAPVSNREGDPRRSLHAI